MFRNAIAELLSLPANATLRVNVITHSRTVETLWLPLCLEFPTATLIKLKGTAVFHNYSMIAAKGTFCSHTGVRRRTHGDKVGFMDFVTTLCSIK